MIGVVCALLLIPCVAGFVAPCNTQPGLSALRPSAPVQLRGGRVGVSMSQRIETFLLQGDGSGSVLRTALEDVAGPGHPDRLFPRALVCRFLIQGNLQQQGVWSSVRTCVPTLRVWVRAPHTVCIPCVRAHYGFSRRGSAGRTSASNMSSAVRSGHALLSFL